MQAPCATFTPSQVLAGRCGNCGWPETLHHAPDDRVLTPAEVGERLSETFDPAGSIDYTAADWASRHAVAIDMARGLLESPLNGDISAAVLRAMEDHPVELTPGEWCDLIDQQAAQLRELEGAGEDIESPDDQARARLVKIAALAITFAEYLDRHKAMNGRVTA